MLGAGTLWHEEISIFELPRPENCISRPRPKTPCPPPPPHTPK